MLCFIYIQYMNIYVGLHVEEQCAFLDNGTAGVMMSHKKRQMHDFKYHLSGDGNKKIKKFPIKKSAFPSACTF